MIEVDVELTLGAFRLAAAFSSSSGVVAFAGRSGSGKTTLLRVVAGLERPQRGRIVVDGHVVVDTDAGICLPPHRRRMGFVFQDAQLFPHLTVRQNLLFGRFFAPRAERRVDFERVVGTLGIGHLLDRRPTRLSGGERQRVAIGRAVLASPRLLLMDEPLASLDDARKAEILPLIEDLRDTYGIPIIYVSHSMDEVARLAGTVVVLDAGQMVAVGPPHEALGPIRAVIEGDRFAAASVLDVNVGRYEADYGLTELEHPAGIIYLPARLVSPGHPVRILVRATDVTLAVSRPQGLSVRTVLEGTVAKVERGPAAVAAVEIDLPGGGRLTAAATRKAVDELGLDAGDRVFALVKTVALDERGLAAAAPTAAIHAG